MSHLHVYINGTVGGKDGTEITNLTVKNLFPAVAVRDDYHPYTGYGYGFVIMPLYIRMDSGYTAQSVVLTGVDTGNYYLYPSYYFMSNYPAESTYLSFSGAQNNYKSRWDANTIIGDTNIITFVVIGIEKEGYNIPENSTMLSISYQEDKV